MPAKLESLGPRSADGPLAVGRGRVPLLYIQRSPAQFVPGLYLLDKSDFYFLHINLITSQMQGASPAIIVMIEASGPKRPPVNNSGPDVTD